MRERLLSPAVGEFETARWVQEDVKRGDRPGRVRRGGLASSRHRADGKLTSEFTRARIAARSHLLDWRSPSTAALVRDR